MSEFSFAHGHAVIKLKNGCKLSMTNYDNGSHCHTMPTKNGYRAVSKDVEVMVFDKCGNIITADFFPDAKPDACYVTDSEVIDVLNKLQERPE